MHFHFDRKAVSAAAKRLRAHLQRQGAPIAHQPALDAVARVLGYEDSNTLMAALKATPVSTPDPLGDSERTRLTTDLPAVLELASKACSDRAANLEDSGDPRALSAELDADLEKIARLKNLHRQLAAAEPPATNADDVLMKAAIRRTSAMMPVGPMSFIEGPDGRPIQATLDRSGAPQRDDPAALERLRHTLRRLCSDPGARLPDRLIAVAEEAPNTFRLVTTLPVTPDIDDPLVEINARLAPHGLGIFEAGGTLVLMRDDETAVFEHDHAAARFLVRRAAMGDPTARLAFGVLRHYAEGEFQALMRLLRAGQHRPVNAETNPARIGHDRPGPGQARLFGWVAWISAQYIASGQPTSTMHLTVREVTGGDGYELVYRHNGQTHLHTADATSQECLSDAAAVAERSGDAWPLGFRPLDVTHDEAGLRIAFTRT